MRGCIVPRFFGHKGGVPGGSRCQFVSDAGLSSVGVSSSRRAAGDGYRRVWGA